MMIASMVVWGKITMTMRSLGNAFSLGRIDGERLCSGWYSLRHDDGNNNKCSAVGPAMVQMFSAGQTYRKNVQFGANDGEIARFEAR